MKRTLRPIPDILRPFLFLSPCWFLTLASELLRVLTVLLQYYSHTCIYVRATQENSGFLLQRAHYHVQDPCWFFCLSSQPPASVLTFLPWFNQILDSLPTTLIPPLLCRNMKDLPQDQKLWRWRHTELQGVDNFFFFKMSFSHFNNY